MKIKQISNLWAKCADKDDISEIKEFLSYEDEYWKDNCRHTYKKSFINSKTGFFPAGFIPLIKEHYDNVEISCFELFQGGTLNVTLPKGVKLWPHQLELLKTALLEKRGILESPTGSGKTLVIIQIISSILMNIKIPTLVLTAKKTMLYQLSQGFTQILQEKIGMVGDNHHEWERITVGMVQTIVNMDKKEIKEKNIGCIIVDEIHHGASVTYQKVLSSINATFRYGVSATPKKLEKNRKDYLKVCAWIGPIIKEMKYDDVKAHLAIPEVIMYDYPVDYLEEGSWEQAYRYGIVESKARNWLISEIARGEKGSVLIMVKRIEHGENLQELLPEAVFVQGKDCQETREEAKRGLGEGKIVIATTIFGEGVDIPALDMVINAAAGKAEVQTIQFGGRALRKAKGKIKGKIVDFWDEGNRHLSNHSYERYNLYKEHGWIKAE